MLGISLVVCCGARNIIARLFVISLCFTVAVAGIIVMALAIKVKDNDVYLNTPVTFMKWGYSFYLLILGWVLALLAAFPFFQK